MRSEERLLELADVAGVQWGLFTSAQASELGFSAQQLKRLADSELVTRLRQGVYRLTGAPESPTEPIRAEWLALEPKRLAGDRIGDDVPVGVVSHRSAARLQGLGDIDADVHEFTVARRRSTRSHDVKFRIRELAHEDWHLVEGLPVTRPRRTVVDLAADGIDGGHLATIVRDAILTGEVTRDELTEALRPFAHRYGHPIGAGAALVRDFIGQAGIPESARSLTRGMDVAFPEVKAASAYLASVYADLSPNLQHGMVLDHNTNAALGQAFAEISRSVSPAVAAATWSMLMGQNAVPPVLNSDVWKTLNSRLFGDESARNRLSEAWGKAALPAARRASADTTGESEGDEDSGSDPEISDRRRASASDQ
ncbi:type IV toxin-antitoxin system AbiEi family antitoxin domain-containing protein [Nocardia carnea]|uniref:type IV toxin-antitoxin system AbiEi family antitoxin domain-containing protein n=1 Tax=Nocardia carnea TaxID=37328 RepID=UPI002458C620|nr:type IV toxin-antitoxin system AbiEi family antitoxin domain-containing protein [Nocardia carnea]